MRQSIDIPTVKMLAFAGIAMALLLIMASSLSNLELSPNEGRLQQWLRQFLQKLSIQEIDVNTAPTGEGQLFLIFLQGFFALIIIGLPFAVIYFIISPEFRRDVLQMLKRMKPLLVFFIMVYAIIRYRTMKSAKDLLDTGEQAQLPDSLSEAGDAVAPLPEFTPEPPQWLVWLSSFALALVLILVLTYIGYLVWSRRRASTTPLNELGGVAQQALDTFQTGGEFKNIIVRCYVEMSRAVQEYRGIQRQEMMTPREFESHLKQAGLPYESVRQLTRMFEAVRYGTKIPGEDEERQTKDSLAAIIEACKSVL